MFWLILAWFVGIIVGIFLLKVVLVLAAVQISLAYKKILGRNVKAEYQQVNVVPDWVKALADSNIYQRYSIDPPRIVPYPAFYRNGFKFFNEGHEEYAVSYDGTGKYTLYQKVRPDTSGNKTKSVVEARSKIKV